jgi:hypothetical protein
VFPFPDSKRFEHSSRSGEFDRGPFPFQAGREGEVWEILARTALLVDWCRGGVSGEARTVFLGLLGEAR